jgi:hypothetical protein
MKSQINAMRRLTGRWIPMPRYERGAATILTVLLIGVGLVSASLGAMHAVRSTQERQLAAHAQVNAQSGVWATVEVVRAYLQTLNKDQLTKLSLNQVWTITGNDNLTQQAILVDIDPPVEPAIDYKVSARLTATDIAARSSSSLEVVYSVTPANPGGNVALNGVLDFYNDLNLGGGITLNVPDGANFNVDGDFTAGSVGITGEGLAKVAVTGNVTIGSNVDAEELWGRNITITGGATAAHIYAFGTPIAEGGVGSETSKSKTDTCCGNITTSGGVTGIQTMNANGNVNSGGNGFAAQVINARGSVTLSGGGSNHGTINAGGNVTAVNGTSVVGIATRGDVTLGGNLVSALTAIGSVTCTVNWQTFPSIKAGGTVTGCNTASGIQQNLNPKPVVGIMEKLPPVKLVQPKVDAWMLRPSANYAMEFEGNKVKVTVNNIQGMTNGTYYIGTYDGKSREYLCSVVDANNRCTSPAAKTDAKPFCNGNGGGEFTGCWTFNKTPGQESWSVTGQSLPPGVMWFKGNLTLNGGNYYNTFVATGNVTTSGQLTTYAINYAGYDPICDNKFVKNGSTDFAGMKPTNFCQGTTFKPSALGNIGILAGGYDPGNSANATTNTQYSGGLINLGAENSIYGTVLSGDILRTGGSTKIYGYISAAGLQLSEDINNLGGSTTVDLMNLPEGYNPNEIPNMDDSVGGTESTAIVLWSRYL